MISQSQRAFAEACIGNVEGLSHLKWPPKQWEKRTLACVARFICKRPGVQPLFLCVRRQRGGISSMRRVSAPRLTFIFQIFGMCFRVWTYAFQASLVKTFWERRKLLPGSKPLGLREQDRHSRHILSRTQYWNPVCDSFGRIIRIGVSLCETRGRAVRRTLKNADILWLWLKFLRGNACGGRQAVSDDLFVHVLPCLHIFHLTLRITKPVQIECSLWK